MNEITRESADMVAQNIRLQQENRRLNGEIERLRMQIEHYKEKEIQAAAFRHRHFARKMAGYDRQRRHSDLRADIGKAGLVMLGLLGVAMLAQTIFMHVWGLA